MGKINHNPDLVWRDEPDEKEKIIIALENGDDLAAEKGWVIIVDGGQMHQLNLIAGEIWVRCDGTRDEREIAAEIAELYDAPIEDITEDVKVFIDGCLQRGWVESGE